MPSLLKGEAGIVFQPLIHTTTLIIHIEQAFVKVYGFVFCNLTIPLLEPASGLLPVLGRFLFCFGTVQSLYGK